jgi:uncharacterized RmlC-like cupin family protein
MIDPGPSNVQSAQPVQVIKSQNMTVEYGEGLERRIAIAPELTQQADISMTRVRIPQGAETPEVHAYLNTHTAIYVEQGEVFIYYGQNLEHRILAQRGDCIYIPPGGATFSGKSQPG